HGLLLVLAFFQVPPPPLPPAPGGAETVPLVLPAPGVLPADTTPEAREAWKKVLDASLAPGAKRERVTSLDLQLDVRYRGADKPSNDLSARYRFLAPGFVRIGTL